MKLYDRIEFFSIRLIRRDDPPILALNVSTAAHVDVLEIQLPKLGNRVSGKRMHPHAPQTRVRK